MPISVAEIRPRASPDAERTSLAIYGSPVASSASAVIHTHILAALNLPRFHFVCSDNTTLSDLSAPFHQMIKASSCLGGTVTNPLKIEVMKHVEHITEEAQAMGAINTLYWRRNAKGREELVGTALDHAGVSNPLLAALLECPSPFPSSAPSSFAPGAASAFCIGAGKAARAAVYAFRKLHFGPIYILNRLSSETEELTSWFFQWDVRPVGTVEEARAAIAEDSKKGIRLVAGVGAIPCADPVTEEEKSVYEISKAIFELPYDPPVERMSTSDHIPLPNQRVFLDLCYKPKNTMLRKLAEKAGWESICGVEAALEVCFEQSYLWTGIVTPLDVREGARALVR